LDTILDNSSAAKAKFSEQIAHCDSAIAEAESRCKEQLKDIANRHHLLGSSTDSSSEDNGQPPPDPAVASSLHGSQSSLSSKRGAEDDSAGGAKRTRRMSPTPVTGVDEPDVNMDEVEINLGDY
jgi:hypothetical protein